MRVTLKWTYYGFSYHVPVDLHIQRCKSVNRPILFLILDDFFNIYGNPTNPGYLIIKSHYCSCMTTKKGFYCEILSYDTLSQRQVSSMGLGANIYDINTQLQLSDTSSRSSMRGGFLLFSSRRHISGEQFHWIPWVNQAVSFPVQSIECVWQALAEIQYRKYDATFREAIVCVMYTRGCMEMQRIDTYSLRHI